MQPQIARSLEERPDTGNDAKHPIANVAQRYRYGDSKHLDIEIAGSEIDHCAANRRVVEHPAQ